MSKFYLRLMLFGLIILALDLFFGFFFRYLQDHPKGGDTLRNNYICNKTNEDVLIFGSSRAMHHYNSQVISDSTGLSCFNCGQDGNGILLAYGRLKMINKRYYPKIIIYDVYQSFDLLEGDDNHKYLKWLRPYYDAGKSIDSIFWDVDYTEKYKMFSEFFQYNSQFTQLIGDYIYPQQSIGINGFRPIKKQMQYEPKKIKKADVFKYDSLKLHYLEKFIRLAKSNSTLVFVVSPSYKAKNSDVFMPLEELCKQYNILLLDYYTDPVISTNKNYFYNSVHLNNIGADVFTKKLTSNILTLKIIE